jgi:hypothetical protein
MNLCDIYQFTADNVISNTTVKNNTCSFDNKCYEKLWIAEYNQSATVMYMPVCHCKTISEMPHFYESCQKMNQSSSSLTFCVSASNNGLLCCACHSLSWSPKIKSGHKYCRNLDCHKWHCCWRISGLMLGQTMGLFGFPAETNSLSTKKLNACAALDISNIWPLGSCRLH